MGARLRHAASAVVAAAGLALLVSGCGNSEAKNPVAAAPARPVTVTTVAAESRSLPVDLEVTGTLTADAQAEVAAEGAGRVVAVQVERGSVVTAGAVLARVDSEDARNGLREAEAMEAQMQARLGLANGAAFDPAQTADVRKARATLERAEVEHQRYARLVESGIVSRSEYDQRRTEAATAKEQYEAALNEARQQYQTLLAQRARVAIARKALADMEVRAPWDGVVAERHVTAGQYVAKGTRIATLVRVDPLRVELAIPESAVGSVRRGQKVSFAVQAYPDARFEGTVAYVGPSLKPDARTLVVEAVVPNASGRLQPGLFATARVELPAAAPVVLVPAAAVRTDAGVSRLWVVRDDRAEIRLVQVGRAIGPLVEAVRGVRAGEQVVAQFDDRLADGAPVAREGR